MSSFGAVIPIGGLNIGFIGQVSRTGGGDPFIVAKFANASNLNNISFGDTVVVLPDSAGGTFRQFADFIANGGATVGLKATLSNTSTTLTVTAGMDTLAPGMFISGTSIPAGTFIVSITPTSAAAGTAVMSQAATATVSTAEVVQVAVFSGIAVREVKTQLSYPYTPGGSEIGYYAAGQMTEALVRGAIAVKIYNGTPLQNGPVYIRVALNTGTYPLGIVGGLECISDGANSVLLPNFTFKTGAQDTNGVSEVTILNRIAA